MKKAASNVSNVVFQSADKIFDENTIIGLVRVILAGQSNKKMKQTQLPKIKSE